MKKPTKKDVVYLIVIALLVVAVVTVSVLWGIAAKEYASEPSYYDQKCASFAKQNSNLSKGQIVFIGDSLTDFYHLDDYFTTLPLATYNRGIAGDTSGGVLDRLQISLFDIAPSKIVLMIGINDINGGKSLEDILTNYRAILTSIKENLPAAEVICESVLPMNATVANYKIDLDAGTEKIKALNVGIQALAQEKGCPFVNLYPLLSDGNDHLVEGYSTDGLHLSAAGYAVVADAVLPFLQ